eukprot:2986194-Pleurochrysis_carterae.AAC.1
MQPELCEVLHRELRMDVGARVRSRRRAAHRGRVHRVELQPCHLRRRLDGAREVVDVDLQVARRQLLRAASQGPRALSRRATRCPSPCRGRQQWLRRVEGRLFPFAPMPPGVSRCARIGWARKVPLKPIRRSTTTAARPSAHHHTKH